MADRFVGWNHGFAWVLCLSIFAGMFAHNAGVRETLYPLGDSGPGLPIALVPAVGAALFGAARTMNALRGMGGGDSAGGP